LKNFTFLAILALFFISTAEAQKNHAPTAAERCGTMQHLEKWQAANPELTRQNQQEIERLLRNPGAAGQGNRLQAIVNIPVVFHIVLTNPFIVTDGDVQAQVDRLNLDFSGLNPDSTNIPASFQAVRGHSQIRFVLAKRTPAGLPTNGIERRSSSTLYNQTLTTDPIKVSAQGGLDAWDATQYLNIWIGTGGGILGYATFPGTSTASQQGVVVDLIGTSNNPCYIDPSYNMGRTMTHEVGHYFGLYHIWGDDGNACTNSDFRNLPGCTISDPLLAGGTTDQTIGDTPNQGDQNFGCPTGTLANSCGNAAGDMYQNYMDYTNDACMTMFTAKQAARMEWVIANCRPGYLTSQAGNPPASAILWDAAPHTSVSPGGFELGANCGITTYTDALSCPGNITPKFRVTNNGVSTITSLVVGYRLNNGTAVTQTVNVNIPTGGFYIASFAPVAAPVGNHTFKFFTSQPNGNADQTPANDTLSQSFRVMAPATSPITEGIETALPLTNWTVDNFDGAHTWTRTTPGRGTSAGKLSIDNYNNQTNGSLDDFRSTTINVNPAEIYNLSFDVAYRNYPDPTAYDSLAVFISKDCGQTFTRVYYKGGPGLSTGAATTSDYVNPPAADWRTEVVQFSGTTISTGQIIIVFRNIGRYGNRLHIDNINLSSLGSRDLRLVSINQPGATQCSPNVTPSVTIANEGTEPVTSFKVGYRIDNGTNTITTFNQTIAAGASATVTLPASSTTSGAHVIWAFTADPVTASGTGDVKTSNDTLNKAFSVVNLASLPIIEGFEGSFPPAGWSIFNPNNNGTWIQRAPGRNSANAAFIDNWTTAGLIGQIDEIRSPFMNIAGADSLIVTFDVAHRNYPGSNDTLRVLATTDCGNTFTSVYGKAGATLATGTSMTGNFVAPTAAQWRNERIALGGSILSTGSMGINFRNRNAYGNNIFIDNINVTALFKRDLRLVSINSPASIICENTVAPAVTVRNVGSETVIGFRVSYSVNGGNAQTQNVTGISLARDAQMNVTLPFISTPAGSYSIRIFTVDPVTASGTGDQNTSNDTLSRSFSVPGVVTAPVVESFTGNTFPPANWGVGNPDNSTTWTRSNLGNANPGSAFLNGFNYRVNGQRDDLSTPVVGFDAATDSVKLSFDLSASTFRYPGSTAVPLDTLEIFVTKDCGNTVTSVYKKWGNELQTIGDPNSPQTDEFLPNNSRQWRRETVDLSSFASRSPIQVLFRVTTNSENNIYIDNVNLRTQTLPLQLKQQGYVIYPTSFRNSFTVWHFQTPSNLKYINVMNSAGQIVWMKQFSGNADRQIPVDLAGKASGLYIVEVGYTDGYRNVQQKIFKQ